MVNRLILNLNHTADTREDLEFRSKTGLEPQNSATGSFLGNIGRPLRTRLDDPADEIPEVNEELYDIVGQSTDNAHSDTRAENEEIGIQFA